MTITATPGFAPDRALVGGSVAIRLEEVSKLYGHAGSSVAALDHVSLEVVEGQFVCLVGASGCGKSTLLNLIAGLDAPTAGRVERPAGPATLMFQDSALFGWLTVAGNVELPMRLSGVGRRERRARAAELLDLVHLGGFADQRPHELSGGMRQRVALARAIAQDRRVVLMDEPFGALDAITRDVLHDELERIWAETGLTVVFVTHNVSEAVRLADRVVLLSSRPGRVAATFDIDLDRPRRDPKSLAALAGQITDRLREEVATMAAADVGTTAGTTTARRGGDRLDDELAGLDRLELELPPAPTRARRLISALWPRLAAVALGVLIWQVVAWSGWKPSYVLPGPGPTLRALWDDRSVVGSGTLTTLRRAVEFYLIALVVGTIVALVVSRNRTVRTAVNPLIAGLQTMPSVAWVPFAIIVFGDTTQSAILFVTLLGTVPAITIGTLSGIDAIPPVLLRAGAILGARGLGRYRHVILPAALPGYIAGMKQGWAFSWRSLMAGELIVTVEGTQSLGRLLSAYQDQSLQADVMATMVVILVIGLVMDSVVFSNLERRVLQRRGLASAG